MKLEGKKVLVVGAGKSGIAASELLLDKKIETVLYDGNKDLDVEKLYEKAPKLKGMPHINIRIYSPQFPFLITMAVKIGSLYFTQFCEPVFFLIE